MRIILISFLSYILSAILAIFFSCNASDTIIISWSSPASIFLFNSPTSPIPNIDSHLSVSMNILFKDFWFLSFGIVFKSLISGLLNINPDKYFSTSKAFITPVEAAIFPQK